MQRLSRLVTPLLIVALCALVAWWVTRLLPGEPIAVPPTAAVEASSGNGRVDAVLASARLFGSRRPGVLSDNVRALGVIADASGRGSVIVSVDGQTPKVYRVGDTLDGRLVSAIRPEEIELESGGARQVFRLPAPRPSATGLTIIGAGPAVSPYAPMNQPPAMSSPPPMSTPPPMGNPPGMPGAGNFGLDPRRGMLPPGTQAVQSDGPPLRR